VQPRGLRQGPANAHFRANVTAPTSKKTWFASSPFVLRVVSPPGLLKCASAPVPWLGNPGARGSCEGAVAKKGARPSSSSSVRVVGSRAVSNRHQCTKKTKTKPPPPI
jgi:hypothetical protein